MVPPWVQVIHKQADEIMTQAAQQESQVLQTFYLTRAVLLLVKTIATAAGRQE